MNNMFQQITVSWKLIHMIVDGDFWAVSCVYPKSTQCEMRLLTIFVYLCMCVCVCVCRTDTYEPKYYIRLLSAYPASTRSNILKSRPFYLLIPIGCHIYDVQWNWKRLITLVSLICHLQALEKLSRHHFKCLSILAHILAPTTIKNYKHKFQITLN